MKKIIFFVLLTMTIVYCTKDDGCIDENKVTNSACPLNYDPVCGCNGKTYGNVCEAQREGITSWTDDKCK
jgi:hypothetical protein